MRCVPGKRIHGRLLVIPGAALWLAAGCTHPLINPQSLEQVEAYAERSHPEVAQVTTDQLAAMLSATAPPILIDARSRNEYQVSHLPGAVWVDASRPPAAALSAALGAAPSPQAQIVVYCSVGVRSTRYAARLIDSGYVNSANLRGSIFRWANEGRPVVRDGAAVSDVHPYNATWGRLLRSDLRTARPRAPAVTRDSAR